MAIVILINPSPLDTENIEILLIKFLNKEVNAEELDQLEDWCRKEKNKASFDKLIRTHYKITLGMNDPDSHKLKQKLCEVMKEDRRTGRLKKMLPYLKYAALALIFVGIGFLMQNPVIKKTTDKKIIPREEAITLELDNGEVQNISTAGVTEIHNSKGETIGTKNEHKLVYKNNGRNSEVLYNKLKVPYGKKFDLFLADGSHIYLNSGSSLRYPVQFNENEPRTVYLEGEAFFKVTHNSSQFKVITSETVVEVFGTSFNVSDYVDDKSIDVVLVEGSVGIKSKAADDNEELMLKPGFKASFNKTDKSLSNEKVNPKHYISWVDNKIVIRNTPFSEIRKCLERAYNIVIINTHDPLETETFNATIETDRETVEQVLDYFSEVYSVNYQVFNNKIIIKPKTANMNENTDK